MSFEHLSTNQPSLFTEPESASASPAPRVKSARSANRAAWWEQDLSRTATYLLGQARTDDERAFVERLYDEAMAEGPLRASDPIGAPRVLPRAPSTRTRPRQSGKTVAGP